MQKADHLFETQCSKHDGKKSFLPMGSTCILDSCIWVYIVEGKFPNRMLNAIRESSLTVIVEENTLGEVARVLKLSEDIVFDKMKNLGLKLRLCIAKRADRDESWTLVESYNMCHYPDSLYLAMCKNNNWTLLSCDGDLLSCARLESVKNCNPYELHLIGVNA